MTTMKMSTKIVLNKIKQRDPDQKEFIQVIMCKLKPNTDYQILHYEN